MRQRSLIFTIKPSRTALQRTKPSRGRPKISGRGFELSLALILLSLLNSMPKSSGGLAPDRTGRAHVIAALANFRFTSGATGEDEAWAICSSPVSLAKRNAWDYGNCSHA